MIKRPSLPFSKESPLPVYLFDRRSLLAGNHGGWTKDANSSRKMVRIKKGADLPMPRDENASKISQSMTAMTGITVSARIIASNGVTKKPRQRTHCCSNSGASKPFDSPTNADALQAILTDEHNTDAPVLIRATCNVNNIARLISIPRILTTVRMDSSPPNRL